MPAFRTHHQQDIDLMSYKEIAERMGYRDPGSAHYVYRTAMAKLRRLLDGRRDEIRELYAPEPEGPGRAVGTDWKVSELPLSRFPLQPRRRK